MSLQTIAYGNFSAAEANDFMRREIFPDAELPTLTDIVAATEGIFEIDRVLNGRLDYSWTCSQWAQRLRSRREEAVGLVGEEVVERYLRYLTMSTLGFRMGKLCLYRIILRPYREGYFTAGTSR
jgi:cyclopropane-fatty-acyl-phospholipid synthase